MITPDFETGYRRGWLDQRCGLRLISAWTDTTTYGSGYRAGHVDAEHTPYGARLWPEALKLRDLRREAA